MDTNRLDKIYITDLLIRCIIGIFPEERQNKQDVILNITLMADLSAACRSDKLEETVDYKTMKHSIIDAVENSQFFLVERLAQEVADICLSNKLVKAVQVRVDKPGALRFAKSVAVEITRYQDD